MSKKSMYYIGTAVVVVIVLVIVNAREKNNNPKYETTTAQKGSLVQNVEATGKVESANEISLHFEVAGTIGEIAVKEGSEVVKNQFLASLRMDVLNAAVDKALADLRKQEAGATKEDIDYYRAALESAKANLKQAVANADSDIAASVRDVEEAQNNLKLAAGGENSEIVNQAYQDAVSTLQATLSKLEDGLTQADNILGIDNKYANDAFETSLSTLDSSKLAMAEQLYKEARAENNNVTPKILPLSANSKHNSVDEALSDTESALLKMNELLKKVTDVLHATVPTDDLTQTSLDTKKTTIETTRTTILAKYTTVINDKQAIVDAKNSLSTYTFAYNQAKEDLTKRRSEAQTNVDLKQASYNQAEANYSSKINPPREVDLAPYRASLAQAVANRNKAVLNSPINGIVTKIYSKVGETISSSEVVIELLAPQYQITVDIPEVDVTKLKIGDVANVTLDAFGPDRAFVGSVAAIEPASTEVQDVVYYKVIVGLTGSLESVRSGMTANVSVLTARKDNVVFIPRRLVRTRDNGIKYVRVLQGSTIVEYDVMLGLKGDGAMIEVVSGLEGTEDVVVRESE